MLSKVGSLTEVRLHVVLTRQGVLPPRWEKTTQLIAGLSTREKSLDTAVPKGATNFGGKMKKKEGSYLVNKQYKDGTASSITSLLSTKP